MCRRFHAARAAQGIAAEIDALGVVKEAIENGIGVGWIADDVVPFVDRQLAGDDGRSAAIALFEDFQEIVARLGGERFEAPIVQDHPGGFIPERWAASNRNGGRHHPGMPGDIKSERWAAWPGIITLRGFVLTDYDCLAG